MSKTVIDLGQCDYDHSNIKSLIESNFDVRVMQAHSAAEGIAAAKDFGPELILVNRIFDGDQSPGLSFIKSLKEDPGTRHIPVMLVSNFADAQAEAIKAGALPGFGKSSLNAPATLTELSKLLS